MGEESTTAKKSGHLRIIQYSLVGPLLFWLYHAISIFPNISYFWSDHLHSNPPPPKKKIYWLAHCWNTSNSVGIAIRYLSLPIGFTVSSNPSLLNSFFFLLPDAKNSTRIRVFSDKTKKTLKFVDSRPFCISEKIYFRL